MRNVQRACAIAVITALSSVVANCGQNANLVSSPVTLKSAPPSRDEGPETLGIISTARYTSTGLEKYLGIFETEPVSGQINRCSGVFVSDAANKKWFVSAKHCFDSHDPLGRASATVLSKIPARVYNRLSLPSYAVPSNNRLLMGDVIKIDLTSLNISSAFLPLCDVDPSEATAMFIAGFGSSFSSEPRVGRGSYQKSPPSYPNLSQSFSSGLEFLKANGNVLYGESGDSGGPVIHSLSYQNYCVMGVSSRQFPLRLTGGFGLTGFTRLKNAIFTSATSWSNAL